MAFSDLVDYTGLSEQVDSEELHAIKQKFQRIALESVECYGGYVSSYSGDGILIFFGYPVTHENDAHLDGWEERASRTVGAAYPSATRLQV